MVALTLTRIGDAIGVVLPREVLARLKVSTGDALVLTQVPDGYRLTPHASTFEEQMAIARDVMNDRRDALRELAK